MSSEENENTLIISNTGGLIRRMDHQLALMNRVLGEIAERKTEIIAGATAFFGMRAGEERDWEIAPGVKMPFCWCPPGEFLMGSPEAEEDRDDDENQVHVILTKGFWMAKTPVTQKQWNAIMGNNPSHFKGENLPVETISWDDAQEFLKKINAKIGYPDGGQMELPTEAQWEYACRAGEKGPFSGGSLDEVAWCSINSGDQTHPVGMKKPNAWGLHDMHGNVYEWCADRYDHKLTGGVDPTGPSSDGIRLHRGGCWGDLACDCSAAARNAISPNYVCPVIGFRLARCFRPPKQATSGA